MVEYKEDIKRKNRAKVKHGKREFRVSKFWSDSLLAET